MDIINRVFKPFGNIAPRNTVPSAQGFRSDVQPEDGDAAYDTEAEIFAAIGAVGFWSTIWELTVPAQQAIAWGYGAKEYPANQGYMFFYAASAAAYDVGTLRLFARNARNTSGHIPVIESADRALHGNVAAIADPSLIDKNEMMALPEHDIITREDSVIGLDYMPIVLVVETKARFKIPITVYQ